MKREIGQVFSTNFHACGTDSLVRRMLDGSGSNKYKSINYVKLRALVSENKDYLLKTAVKLHKINNISQCNKDRAILKQHQLIWQKEFLHLLHLKRKLHSECESHFQRNANIDSCSQMYSGLHQFHDMLLLSYNNFKRDTVDPVWDLRNDLKYWLSEKQTELRLGDPEVILRHAEIQDTILFVKSQQEELMTKLYQEQKCLEEDLDKSVSTLDGIPTEAIEMECPNSEFKCSMLQEFIILDTKYKACIDNVNKCHSHATCFDDCGGWSPDDHILFVFLHDQYPQELPSSWSLLVDRLLRQFSSKSRSQLLDHVGWWSDHKHLKERLKSIHNDWSRDRRELMVKVRLTFQEARLADHLDSLHFEKVLHQKELCHNLYQKVVEWRKKKFGLMRLEQELEEQRRELVEERLAEERDRDQKKRQHDREKVLSFQLKRKQQSLRQQEAMELHLKCLREELAQHAMFDVARVKYRQEMLKEKEADRVKCEGERKLQEYKKERRLEALREQVRVVAESKPSRTMQVTEAWRSHCADDSDDRKYVSIQKPLFEINTFTASQVTGDARVRMENRLREAGLHNTDYARTVLMEIRPPRIPRKDTIASHCWLNAT